MFTPNLLLLLIFPVGGVIMVIAGILTITRLYGNRSVEVDAECIGITVRDMQMGLTPGERTTYHNTKRPRYRYFYEGKEYISSPLLSSNRPGYRPETGYCKIRINPSKPEKVYSSERKFAGIILISIGSSWLLVTILVIFLMQRFLP